MYIGTIHFLSNQPKKGKNQPKKNKINQKSTKVNQNQPKSTKKRKINLIST